MEGVGVVRFLIVLALVGKLLVAGWLVGSWPDELVSTAWSRTASAIDALRGVESEGPLPQTLEFCRLLEDPDYQAGEISGQQARRHWEAVIASAPGHLRHETLTLYSFNTRNQRIDEYYEDPAIHFWPLEFRSAALSLSAEALQICGW